MNYYEKAVVANARQHHIESQAQQDHLAAEAKENHRINLSELYAPALAKAGDMLVEVGQQLQRRYGHAPAPLAQPTLADAK